ncbi:hypothetical protein BJX61DRAFT_121175 [Aspergillus egyptiacus]|nr:hypothetical protein BJX61DRAFT_121175 [Aspergillus egyptiacus]
MCDCGQSGPICSCAIFFCAFFCRPRQARFERCLPVYRADMQDTCDCRNLLQHATSMIRYFSMIKISLPQTLLYTCFFSIHIFRTQYNAHMSTTHEYTGVEAVIKIQYMYNIT